jgi:hypothetical protein
MYPDNWKVSEEAADGRPGLSLESPGGSFLSISAMEPEQDAEDILDEAAQAMDAEYEDVESEPCTVDIAGQSYPGVIQRFYYLDFVVASKLLAIDTDDQMYLVQIQGEDRDMDQQSIVFEAILTSMLQSLHGSHRGT